MIIKSGQYIRIKNEAKGKNKVIMSANDIDLDEVGPVFKLYSKDRFKSISWQINSHSVFRHEIEVLTEEKYPEYYL